MDPQQEMEEGLQLPDAPATCTFRFLDLPPELRDNIYRELLVRRACEVRDHDNATHAGTTSLHLEIMRVSKKIHAEAGAVLYGDNDFRLTLTSNDSGGDRRGCSEAAIFEIALRQVAGRTGKDHAKTASVCGFRCRLKVLLRTAGMLCHIRTLHLRISASNNPCDIKCRNSKIWYLVAAFTTPVKLHDGRMRKESRLKRVMVEIPDEVIKSQVGHVTPDEQLNEMLAPLAELPPSVTIECTDSRVQSYIREKQFMRPCATWLAYTNRYVDAQRRFWYRSTKASMLIPRIVNQDGVAGLDGSRKGQLGRSGDLMIDPFNETCLERLMLAVDWEEQRDNLTRELLRTVDKYEAVFGAMRAKQRTDGEFKQRSDGTDGRN